MPDILTVTANPAVDVATSVERVTDTRKLRCGPARRDPGGGGINIARVLQRLGADYTALYLGGGATGGILKSMLEAEGIRALCVPITGETRESFSVHEAATNREYRFVLPGPTVSGAEWARLEDCIIQQSGASARYLALSGSLPPGVPSAAYARVAAVARARGMRVVLDTSGPALAEALEVGVFLVKPSLNELSQLCGHALTEEAAWCDAAREIVLNRQAEIVALTLGERGALLVTAEGALHAPALPVTVASAIGAGDSFVAAMIWALNRGSDVEDAFRRALAAASASLLVHGTALCDAADVERFYGEHTAHLALRRVKEPLRNRG